MANIAVLFPGAVGRALADALGPSEHSLLTFVADRSPRTRDNAQGRLSALASFDELVDAADVVVSVVPPDAALDVAHRYAEALGASRCVRRDHEAPLFVEANSISPRTAREIDRIISRSGARCVDGVFLGPSTPITDRTLLMLSGSGAEEALAIFAPMMNAAVVSDRIGDACAVKMAMALATKALTALFVEMACAAGKADCLEPTLQVMRRLYGGTMAFVERNLPTFRLHGARRIAEMREVQEWLKELGQAGTMTAGATSVLERLVAADLASCGADFDSVLRYIVARQPLADAPPSSRLPHAASYDLAADSLPCD